MPQLDDRLAAEVSDQVLDRIGAVMTPGVTLDRADEIGVDRTPPPTRPSDGAEPFPTRGRRRRVRR